MGLQNAKIGRKLFLLISFSVVIFFSIAATGFYFMQQMKANSEQMYQDALLPIKWQSLIRINNRAVDGYTLEMLLTTDSKVQNELRVNITERIEENNELEALLQDAIISEAEKAKMVQFRESYEIYLTELQKVGELAFAGDIDFAYAMYEKEVKGTLETTNALLEEIGTYLEKYADDLDTSITASVKTSNLIVIMVILVALALQVATGIVITRMIVNPLKEIGTLMSEAEQGNLTVEGKYRSKDEIGVLTTSFNSMVSRLRELMRQVNDTSEQVAASSEELTASAEHTPN